MNADNLHKEFSFWKWWFRYGLFMFMNWWLLFHLIVGCALYLLVPSPYSQIAQVIVIPLVGVLIGLSLAWAGNAIAIMQSQEFRKMASKHPRGIKEYLYGFQSSILALLVLIVLWSLIALGIQNSSHLAFISHNIRTAIKILLFSLSSLAIRECWQIVLSTQWLLLSKHNIEELNKSQHNENNAS
jgi:hypothetical protein